HKTINPRTFKPEPGGLFDPRIFGPFLNYECYCGKYKGKENKGQKCERCEVLATNLSKLLGIPSKKLEDIIYLRAYVVIDNGLTNLLTKGEVLEKRIDRSLISDILQEIIQNKELSKSVIEEAKELNEKITKKIDKSNEEITDVVFLDDYLDFLEKHCRVKIWTGTEAFRELLVGIDIAAELAKVKQAVKENPQKVSNEKLRFLQVTKLKEEDVIATNQHNNSLYRIILRCQRLNYYLDLNKSSGIFFRDIIHNEKRGLQKSVDQVIYGSTYKQSEVKSLLQSLSGKEGILRRYSLGKRGDYSARS
ncbi:1423_t:CDS:2, partial [Entrophospora sp. SA101]